RRRMEIRCNLVDGLRACRRRSATRQVDAAQAGRCKACWIGNHVLLLTVGSAALPLGNEQVSQSESIVENTESAAQHGLGRCSVLVPIERIRKRDARSPVTVVRDMILRLPPQPP